MNDKMKPKAKVLFRVPNEDGSAEVETLWATNLGGDKYKIDNSPFYAYGVSWEARGAGSVQRRSNIWGQMKNSILHT